MKKEIGNPPPATNESGLALSTPFKELGEISIRPGEGIRVKRKRRFFSSPFGSRKEEKECRSCKEADKVSFEPLESGLVVDCSSCAFESDLSCPECRQGCAELLSSFNAKSLLLKGRYYQKEYLQEELNKLSRLLLISKGLDLHFPKECGICGEEHKDQLRKVRDYILKNPKGLVKGAIEVSENEELSVEGVSGDACRACEKRVRGALRDAEKELDLLIGERALDFSPYQRPFFSNAKIRMQIPRQDEILKDYEVCGSRVVIGKGREETYMLFPREHFLKEDYLEALKRAYGKLGSDEGNGDFLLFCKDMISEELGKEGSFLPEADLFELASLLSRCSKGLDVIELLLLDDDLQDIYVNSPIASNPIQVKHRDYGDCKTNIYLGDSAARNIISKFRLRSGRPFSEISPVLDMELPEFGARVNVTGPPVSPDGLSFSFRRANSEPWTLLSFIENGMLSPFSAGLLSLLVNEESSILLCGDRGSGKTSMLSALISAMPQKQRILTIEDTLEVPVAELTERGGFKIQRMKVRPATSFESFEKDADSAMRSLLRMGDSAIVMGEVRGREAKVLYEAMNVGGSGNCVLGTIHGKSPRSLLERVIHSLGVPAQYFKATDLLVIADRMNPGGGSRTIRRVRSVVEVRKDWKDESEESVFREIMRYDAGCDSLLPTDDLLDGVSEVIAKVAGRRGCHYSEVISDCKARAKVYEHAVRLHKEGACDELLRLESIVRINKDYKDALDAQLLNSLSVDYGLLAKEVEDLIDRRLCR